VPPQSRNGSPAGFIQTVNLQWFRKRCGPSSRGRVLLYPSVKSCPRPVMRLAPDRVGFSIKIEFIMSDESQFLVYSLD
jgi:hypothetical protein